jgi:hypothetical protein
VLTFIEQHLLAFLVIWTVIATLSWWIVRKNSAVKDGLDLRFLGTVLIILAVTTASLFSRSAGFFFYGFDAWLDLIYHWWYEVPVRTPLST